MSATERYLITFPDLAGQCGISLYKLDIILGHRPDLADLIVRASGRRHVMAADIATFQAAVDAATQTPATSAE